MRQGTTRRKFTKEFKIEAAQLSRLPGMTVATWVASYRRHPFTKPVQDPTMEVMMPKAIAVVSDLIFSTKISGTARAVGFDAKIVSTTAALGKALDADNVRLVIVDMSLADDVATAALRCGASHASKPTTVAFYSHVQSELREAAEQAGADLIMARSQFSEQLPQLLGQYCADAD